MFNFLKKYEYKTIDGIRHRKKGKKVYFYCDGKWHRTNEKCWYIHNTFIVDFKYRK